jgi:integrase
MSVRLTRHKRGWWEVDIRYRTPEGKRDRDRCKAPVASKSGALRWAQDRERHLLQHGPERKKKEVPCLEEFAPRFIIDHARANGLKPGGINHKETLLRVHLIPALGQRRLDSITTADVQKLKDRLNALKPKSRNNILTLLNTMLKKAVEWDVIDRLPCTIKLLKAQSASVDFFDFEEFDRLVGSAKQCDWRTHLIVLLAGQAGLRSGEMRALRWKDVNLDTRQIRVEQSEWRGQITPTKSGRIRYVPMTTPLVEALRQSRHLRGPLVLHRENGEMFTEAAIRAHVDRAARNAGLREKGPHMLRHTFCSHLAMNGVDARSIQELAGHQSILTTQRYMHLSPSAVANAIRVLEQRPAYRGDIGETASAN